jgi:hypothetical protein
MILRPRGSADGAGFLAQKMNSWFRFRVQIRSGRKAPVNRVAFVLAFSIVMVALVRSPPVRKAKCKPVEIERATVLTWCR